MNIALSDHNFSLMTASSNIIPLHSKQTHQIQYVVVIRLGSKLSFRLKFMYYSCIIYYTTHNITRERIKTRKTERKRQRKKKERTEESKKERKMVRGERFTEN